MHCTECGEPRLRYIQETDTDGLIRTGGTSPDTLAETNRSFSTSCFGEATVFWRNSVRLSNEMRQAKYAKLVGLDNLAPHDLRHSCAGLCHGCGGELEQIQLLDTDRFRQLSGISAASRDSTMRERQPRIGQTSEGCYGPEVGLWDVGEDCPAGGSAARETIHGVVPSSFQELDLARFPLFKSIGFYGTRKLL